MKRCAWATNQPDFYQEYHDTEWAVPLHDEHKLFEFLVLEGAQAGLSWSTVLKKREGYREAFENFDPKKVANFSENKIQELIVNPNIIRNKLKIRSAVQNAAAFLKIQDEFGSFDNYIWSFVNHKPIINAFVKLQDIPAKTDLSDKISKDLKKRGFNFVGSTIMYAFMQATGMVNDHQTNCFRYKEV